VRLFAAKGVEGAVCVCPLIAAMGVCPLFGEGSVIGCIGLRGPRPAAFSPTAVAYVRLGAVSARALRILISATTAE
jgi:hypothetical protein